MNLAILKTLTTVVLVGSGAAIAQEAGSFTLQDAIRRAWTQQAGLQAGQAMADRARFEAESMKRLRLPTVSLGLGISRTDEPMMAFGMKLNQSRISMMDFMPDRLNHPNAITATGGTLTVSQPIYAGGKLDAARKAGLEMAHAEGASQKHRQQQVALAVTQAYFGTLLADQAVRYAEDTLKQARELERFVGARVEQGLMLQSELDRSKAFRAQSEAAFASAKAQVASAKSGLCLLAGCTLEGVTLSSPLDADLSVDIQPQSDQRQDLQAIRHQVEAAKAGVSAAKGSLKPEVGATLTLGTLRHSWSQGGEWTHAALGAKWNFSFSELSKIKAASASARAAELGLKWQEQVARREVEEAKRTLATAKEKIASAKVAVEASESVRSIRSARHREGLMPLVEVLDAESALSGARTLLLASLFEHRIGLAQLAFASGQPIENVADAHWGDRLAAQGDLQNTNVSEDARPMSPQTPVQKASQACLLNHDMKTYNNTLGCEVSQ